MRADALRQLPLIADCFQRQRAISVPRADTRLKGSARPAGGKRIAVPVSNAGEKKRRLVGCIVRGPSPDSIESSSWRCFPFVFRQLHASRPELSPSHAHISDVQ